MRKWFLRESSGYMKLAAIVKPIEKEFFEFLVQSLSPKKRDRNFSRQKELCE